MGGWGASIATVEEARSARRGAHLRVVVQAGEGVNLVHAGWAAAATTTAAGVFDDQLESAEKHARARQRHGAGAGAGEDGVAGDGYVLS